MKFHSTDELIADIAAGKMVILVDDEDRENEGDLVLAADHVTPAAINFMAAKARGLICLALTAEQVDRLKLPLMVPDNLNFTPNRTAFTVSIEASQGVTTGISAADRAHTIKTAAATSAAAGDIHTPGHIFPIRAQGGGVLKRAGHTEGSVDLARLAGLNPSAVICEVMNEDGTMARASDLVLFAEKYELKIGTIVDLIEYRLRTETFVEEVSLEPTLPMALPRDFKVRVFRNRLDGLEHLVLQKGEIPEGDPALVRIQVDHYVRETFNWLQFGESSLAHSLARIEERGQGVLILLRGQNRPQISAEIKSWTQAKSADPLKSLGLRSPTMDERDYGVGAQILRSLGISQIELITSKPERRVGIRAYGLEIVKTLPLIPLKTLHD